MSRKKRSPKSPAAEPAQAGGSRLRLPAAAAGVLAALWAAGTALAYFRRGLTFELDAWRGFLQLAARYPAVLAGGLLGDLALAVLLWLGAVLIGRHIVERLGAGGASCSEKTVVSSAAAMGLFSLLFLFLGLMRLWSGALFIALTAALAVWIGRELISCFAGEAEAASGKEEAASQEESRAPGAFEYAAGCLILAAALLNVLASTVPEVFYDSLVYHLSLPRLYLLRGGVVPTPENVYSGIPFGAQMLFGWALAVSGEKLASLLHASFGMAAAFGIWAWCRARADRETGMLAALLFYLAPLGMYASWYCGVDLASSFFVAAAFVALSRALEEEDPAGRRGWQILCGALTGFAMSTKYNAFPIGALIIAVHGFLAVRSGRSWKESLPPALAAGLVLSPWLLKNVFFYGNPLYPFLHKYLGWVQPADWRGFVDAAGSRPLGSLATWAGLKSALVFPWTASLSDWPLGDWPGPAFVALVPWALLVNWGIFRKDAKSMPWAAAALLAGGGYISWLMASTLVRYAMPVFPLLALVAALAVLRAGLPRWARAAGWLAALASCVYCFQAAFRQGLIIGQWNYLHGKEPKREYLTRQRTTYGLPYYAAAVWANENLPKDAKLLFLGESRAYYFERDFIAATVFDHNPFWTLAAQAKSGAEIAEGLARLGVTHLFVSAGQLHYRNASPAVFPKEVAASEAFGEFWSRRLARRFEDKLTTGADPRWLIVYEVLPEAKPASAPDTECPPREVLKMLGYSVVPVETPRYKLVGPTRF